MSNSSKTAQKSFAEALRKARGDKTQEQFGKMLGVSGAVISTYERCRVMPSLETYTSIVRVCPELKQSSIEAHITRENKPHGNRKPRLGPTHRVQGPRSAPAFPPAPRSSSTHPVQPEPTAGGSRTDNAPRVANSLNGELLAIFAKIASAPNAVDIKRLLTLARGAGVSLYTLETALSQNND